MMKGDLVYGDGTLVKLGDMVDMNGGYNGTVVLIIGKTQALGDLQAADWNYLENGVMIMSDFGLMHYDIENLAYLELISRAN